jgi:uncharacterized protein YkwD
MPTPRRSALIVSVFLIGSLVSPVASWGSHSRKHDNHCYQFTDDEKDLAHRMNRARARNGLRKMHHDPELSKVARKNSKKMADEGVLEHTGLQRLRHRVTREVLIGEAVVVADTVKEMMRLIKGSSTHRALMLGSFEHFGVGIIKGRGKKWATIVFSGHKNPETTLEMPDC